MVSLIRLEWNISLLCWEDAFSKEWVMIASIVNTLIALLNMTDQQLIEFKMIRGITSPKEGLRWPIKVSKLISRFPVKYIQIYMFDTLSNIYLRNIPSAHWKNSNFQLPMMLLTDKMHTWFPIYIYVHICNICVIHLCTKDNSCTRHDKYVNTVPS